MRFVALALERYGLFTDRRLQFRANARLHILHGANEAGKTSALSAISDLLFGFDKSTPYDFQHANKALRLGAILRLADGRLLEFRRRKGNANTLVDAQDQPLPDTLLAAVTGTLTRERFQAEFGLTADALRVGGKNLLGTGGKLAEMLAAGSAGMSALSRLSVELDTEAEKLFGARQSEKKPFYIAKAAHENGVTLMNDRLVTGEKWKAANVAVETAATALLAAEIEQKQLAGELARLMRARATVGILRRIDRIHADLADLETLPEIEKALPALWHAALAEMSALARDQATLLEAHAKTEKALSALRFDQAVLDAGPELELLRERIGAIDQGEADLPNRIEVRGGAALQLAEFAHRLHFADAPALLMHLPNAAALERARVLTVRAQTVGTTMDEALKRLAVCQADMKRFDEEGEPLAHLVDPAPLKIRVDALAGLAHEPENLRRETQTLASEDQRLAGLLARLDPSPGDIDRATRLALPETAVLGLARQEIETLEREAAKLALEGEGLHTKISTAEHDIESLSGQGEALTTDTLAQARLARDVAMLALAAVLNGQDNARQARLETLQALTRRTDDVADRLISAGDRAAQRLQAERQLARAQMELALHLQAQTALAARQLAALASWNALWAATGLLALPPAPMLAWLEKLTDILRQHEALRQKRVAIATMQAGLDEKRPVLAALAAELGLSEPAPVPPDVVYKQVVARLAQVQEAWNQSRARAADGKARARNLAEAQADLVQWRDADAEWRAQWPEMLVMLGQAADTSPAAADAAISLWAQVEKPRDKLADADYRIAGIERRSASFHADVAQWSSALAPELRNRPAREALAGLLQRLQAARTADAERQHLTSTLQQNDHEIEELAGKRRQASSTIDQAQQALGVTGDIVPALAALEQRQKLRSDLLEAHTHVRDAGDDHAQDILRAEQADIDPDQIPALIDACQIRAEAGNQAYAKAYALRQEAAQRRDKLAQGANADEALQARVEAGADMVRIGEDWLVRMAAMRLARTAIQLHRARVQDPVIARASELFATITGGGFDGLVLAYGKDDQPGLVGQRASGSTVAVEGMSEGTRDQLFLVLRLALLAQSAHEPMPFIGDDLLASFDEARTGQALDLLAEIGTNRQVLLFTHHAHVAEIAQARLGTGLDLIAL